MSWLDSTASCRFHGTFGCDRRDRTDDFYKDNHGWSVLHLAVYGRHLDTVKLLLEHPLVSKTRLQGDENGFTAEDWLGFELDGHSYRTIGDLAFHKSRCCRTVTRLRQAARSGNVALAELLLQRGDDVNGSNSGRRTALYYAAQYGHTAMLDLLLQKGANPNVLPIGRRTWESFISNDAVLQRLRQFGYKKPPPSEEIDQQIRLALRQQGHSSFFRSSDAQVVFQESSSLAREVAQESGEEKATAKSDETKRTGVNKLWKRLRGQ
ncbi:Ankyrin-1 [Beauveria bassiana]|nr:Ankyrin-1 [Beauveria bassiana]KAH8717933.1 Ankyrin-1 [Beauveria bassiana]